METAKRKKTLMVDGTYMEGFRAKGSKKKKIMGEMRAWGNGVSSCRITVYIANGSKFPCYLSFFSLSLFLLLLFAPLLSPFFFVDEKPLIHKKKKSKVFVQLQRPTHTELFSGGEGWG